MRDACREIGWDYEIFTGIGPILGRNVRWLPGYRQDRYCPSEGAAAHIMEAFTVAVAQVRKPPAEIKVGVYSCPWGVCVGNVLLSMVDPSG